MKIKYFNNDNIKEEEINDKVIRVKALLINSKKEILLAEAFTTIQFPGGHLEDGESLNDGLIREVKEETGIVLKGVYEPFFAIKHFIKDFPVAGNNRSIEIYYFLIPADEVYNLDNINLDDQERKGEFKLYYIPIKKFKKTLMKNIDLLDINRVVTEEMLLAMNECKKISKRG